MKNKFFNINVRNKWIVCFYFMIGFFLMKFVFTYNIYLEWREISFRIPSTNIHCTQPKEDQKFKKKNMSCERALNFDQWKTISENYEPVRVWLWLVYKFTYNYCRLRLFSKFIQTQEVSYLSWPNMYPNMKTTFHIKLKFFMWTKLLENLLLAKYLISVTAPLRQKKVKYFTMKIIAAFLIPHEDIGKRLLQSNLRKRVGFCQKIFLCFIFFFFFSVAFILLAHVCLHLYCIIVRVS